MVSRSRITFVIVNRRAHRLETESALLNAIVTPRDRVRVIETWTLDDLEKTARTIAKNEEDIGTVVLAGGDGSYMAGVTAIERAFAGRALPRFAFAPGGTVSTIARNWGLSGDHAKYTHSIFDAIASGRATASKKPTLRVRDDATTRVGFIVGAGLVSRFFEEYEATGAPGYGGAAKIVARVFGGSFVGGRLAKNVLTPVPCAISIDGTPAPFDRTSLFCASVVRDLGLGMHLLYRAGEEAERFHVVATPLGPGRLGPQMPLVLLGKPLLGTRVDTLAREASLRFPTEDAYVLDGELFRTRELGITAGPEIELVDVG